MKDHRMYPRFNDHLDAEYDYEDKVLGLWVSSKANTLNISQGGVAMPLTRIIKPGAKIHIKISLVDDKEISAIGEVVWKKSMDIRHPEASLEAAGIKFTFMFKDDADTLAEYTRNEIKH